MKDRADESSWRWWVRWKVFSEWGRLVWMWFLGGKGGDWCESFVPARRDGGGWLWLSRVIGGTVQYIWFAWFR